MGTTLQQHRAAVGTFVSRLVSSGWTARSGDTARAWRREKGREEDEDPMMNHLAMERSLLVAAMMPVLTTLSAVILLLSILLCPAGLGQGRASSSSWTTSLGGQDSPPATPLAAPLAMLLLLLSGDVETNPGPEREELGDIRLDIRYTDGRITCNGKIWPFTHLHMIVLML